MQEIEPLDPVIIDGRHLRRPDVVTVARGRPPVHLDAAGRSRAHAASELASHISAVRPIYGRSTGVGANRIVTVTDDAAGHGLRLLRSHASGAGELEPPDRARAMMAVRLNQLAAGGSGVDPRVLDALVAALDTGAIPAVHQIGAIGTGDLCALADLALALCGDRPWITGTRAGRHPFQLRRARDDLEQRGDDRRGRAGPGRPRRAAAGERGRRRPVVRRARRSGGGVRLAGAERPRPPRPAAWWRPACAGCWA